VATDPFAELSLRIYDNIMAQTIAVLHHNFRRVEFVVSKNRYPKCIPPIDVADHRIHGVPSAEQLTPDVQLAHKESVASGKGEFWKMHDLLFANQQRVQRADLVGYTKQLGPALEKDIDSDSVKQAIAADVAEGTKSGMNGTPSYSIKGKLYSGTRTLAQLKGLLVGEQRRARALAESSDISMSKGPADARVTLEFLADLQSPVSRTALDIVNQVAQRYPAAVRIQFRNFPLAFHPQAGLAHQAVMTAAREGLFWEFAAYVLVRAAAFAAVQQS
jgi:protein-disulfide isomerase